MSAEKSQEIRAIASNKKAYFDYLVLDKVEAGIVLQGCEVKSVRNGDLVLSDCYAKILKDEWWLVGCHIRPYKEGNRYNDDPLRSRKLLLKKQEMKKWASKANEKGLQVIPLRVYFDRHLVKVELGLCKPKKIHDKREALKEKSLKRDLERQGKY